MKGEVEKTTEGERENKSLIPKKKPKEGSDEKYKRKKGHVRTEMAKSRRGPETIRKVKPGKLRERKQRSWARKRKVKGLTCSTSYILGKGGTHLGGLTMVKKTGVGEGGLGTRGVGKKNLVGAPARGLVGGGGRVQYMITPAGVI